MIENGGVNSFLCDFLSIEPIIKKQRKHVHTHLET
jgi:hypothetical protein